ncbi:hypothetical protein [Rhizobium sp. BR 249]|uniref:hypothetical protein n=1 Tax=Rhizobium sp. BR 249 TaxID=3040011 RepID=UPI0039BF172F
MSEHLRESRTPFETRASSLALEAQKAHADIARSSDENRASRLFIMRYIVLIYTAALFFIGATTIIGGFYTKNVTDAATSLKETATTLVLPVVTLVLGYYFGREGRETNK